MSYWNVLLYISDFVFLFWSWVVCFDVCLDFLMWLDIFILFVKLSFWKGNLCLWFLILCKWEVFIMRLIIWNIVKKYNLCLYYYFNIVCFWWFWFSYIIFCVNFFDWFLFWIMVLILNLIFKIRVFGCLVIFLEIMEFEKIYINIL